MFNSRECAETAEKCEKKKNVKTADACAGAAEKVLKIV